MISSGAGLALAGLYTSSYVTTTEAYLVTYCLMNGLGCGMCYFIPLVCGWEYFPNRKGLVSGIILAGYGFSSFIFAHASTALVNPDHANPTISDPVSGVTYFDETVAMRLPKMMRTLTYTWTVIVIVSVCLISRP